MDDLKWIECRILTTYEAQEAIAHILHEADVNGIVIEDLYNNDYLLNATRSLSDQVYMKTYLQKGHLLEEKVRQIKEGIQHVRQCGIDVGRAELELTEVDEEDWATSWEKYYKPIKISDKMMIIPTWEDVKRRDDDQIIVELDPGLAFGTGSHASTALCLRALERYVSSEDDIIDVGCGSGILSIASILLGAKHVLAIDNDPLAIKSTQLNAQLNDISERLTIQQSNLLTDHNQAADLIVSNILAEVIISFAEDAWTHLRDGGLFITSGIIEQKSQLVSKTLKEVGFETLDIQKEDGWVCMIAKK